jgi:hypothetical protein
VERRLTDFAIPRHFPKNAYGSADTISAHAYIRVEAFAGGGCGGGRQRWSRRLHDVDSNIRKRKQQCVVYIHGWSVRLDRRCREKLQAGPERQYSGRRLWHDSQSRIGDLGLQFRGRRSQQFSP